MWPSDEQLGQGMWSSDMDFTPPSNDMDGFPALDFNADWVSKLPHGVGHCV